MFELSVQREFCAAHAIVIRGVREPLHGHNWRVTVTVAGDQLDADGLLCDFHLIERELDRLTSELNNRNLNETPPFDALNPTAEHLARHLGQSLSRTLPGSVRLVAASVTEAPSCLATYRP